MCPPGSEAPPRPLQTSQIESFVTDNAVVWRCSIEKVFEKFRKIHRKTPVPESLF